jgi:hypothetical protein
LSEPPEIARAHWKPLARAMERLENVRAQQTAFGAEANRLRGELGPARQRDQEALGRALRRRRGRAGPGSSRNRG